MVEVLLALAVALFLSCFFYRSLWTLPLLAPVGIGFYRKRYRQKGERQREELCTQFRECILSVSTLLTAGYSVENAFLECAGDMEQMYGDESLICGELRSIRRGLHINISLEEILTDLGERSHCEEILQFAEVFVIAKRNGGNLADIIRNTAGLIGKKAEVRQEIDTLLAGRKMELGIMKAMPFAIMTYIALTNQGFFDPLYDRLMGRLVMTGCLLAYIGAYLVGDLLLDKLRNAVV